MKLSSGVSQAFCFLALLSLCVGSEFKWVHCHVFTWCLFFPWLSTLQKKKGSFRVARRVRSLGWQVNCVRGTLVSSPWCEPEARLGARIPKGRDATRWDASLFLRQPAPEVKALEGGARRLRKAPFVGVPLAPSVIRAALQLPDWQRFSAAAPKDGCVFSRAF